MVTQPSFIVNVVIRVLVSVCMMNGVYGQNIPSINSPVPVSPSVAALAKYSEVPVGYYTGIPSINVPMYEIKTGGITVPVDISYHAGGLRVEEIASSVGMGWSLNAGGVIMRQVRGIADETINKGWLYTNGDISRYTGYSMTLGERASYAESVKNGQTDSEQDMFTYNFGGQSGKFVLNSDRTATSIPLTKNKFQFGSFLGVDSSFKVTATDGSVYYFTAPERTLSGSSNGNYASGYTQQCYTAWYLTKIINAMGTDSVTFSYNNTELGFGAIFSQTKYIIDYTGSPRRDYIPIADGTVYNDFVVTTIYAKKLSQIRFKNGTVTFTPQSTPRPDCYGDDALGKVVITSDKGDFYKEFRLYQSIDSGMVTTGYNPASLEERKRLFLDSVSIYSNDGREGAYNFNYDHTAQLPMRSTYAQDFWGHFNGQISNPYVFPTLVFRLNASASPLTQTGGNRYPDSTFNQLGILKSIVYPTGGKTLFEYETNVAINVPSYIYNGTPPASYPYVHVGGLRIKKISEYASDVNVPRVRRYRYANGYLTSFTNYLNSTAKEGYISASNTSYALLYVTLSSNSHYPLSTTQGSYVGYGIVEELYGENGEFGKKTYEYTGSDNYPDDEHTGDGQSEFFDNFGYWHTSSGGPSPVQITLASPGFPYAPSTTYDWKRGRPLSIITSKYNPADASYKWVEELLYNYTDNWVNPPVQMKMASDYSYTQSTSPSTPMTTSVWKAYTNTTGWFPPNTETRRVYSQDDASGSVTTTTEYGYGSNHYQPTLISTESSNGDTIKQRMLYTLDYTGLSGSDSLTAGIRKLQALNVVDAVIEKYEQKGSSNQVTNAVLTAYKPSIPQKDIAYYAALRNPVASFVPTAVAGGSITKSNLYKPEVIYNLYDEHGNIREQQKINDVKNTYLWDYAGSYPVADVVNASFGDIAFASFEADNKGNWDYMTSAVDTTSGITGRKSLKLSISNVERTGLDPVKTYLVTYWQKDGSGSTSVNSGSAGTILMTKKSWTLYRLEITNVSSVLISGNAIIDELRLYPKNAQVNTSTFDPLIGMTSRCDVNNRITYYEYDHLGRLRWIRDMDNNIIKSFRYAYAQ